MEGRGVGEREPLRHTSESNSVGCNTSTITTTNSSSRGASTVLLEDVASMDTERGVRVNCVCSVSMLHGEVLHCCCCVGMQPGGQEEMEVGLAVVGEGEEKKKKNVRWHEGDRFLDEFDDSHLWAHGERQSLVTYSI